MSGSNVKYKGREGKKRTKQTFDNNYISLINSYLLYYNKSDLQPII